MAKLIKSKQGYLHKNQAGYVYSSQIGYNDDGTVVVQLATTFYPRAGDIDDRYPVKVAVEADGRVSCRFHSMAKVIKNVCGEPPFQAVTVHKIFFGDALSTTLLSYARSN